MPKTTKEKNRQTYTAARQLFGMSRTEFGRLLCYKGSYYKIVYEKEETEFRNVSQHDLKLISVFKFLYQQGLLKTYLRHIEHEKANQN